MSSTNKIDTELCLNGNPFVQYFFRIYDKTYFPKESDIVYKRFQPSDIDDTVFEFWKKKKVSIGLQEAKQAADISIPIIVDNISGKDIANFCDFVRVVEKVTFYKNSPESNLVVDSSVDDSTKKLMIKTEDYIIKITVDFMERQALSANLAILDDMMESGGKDTVLRIVVKRKYGKQMENEFIVLNGETTYNDSSDLYLINTVNLILKNYINKFFQKSVSMIEKIKEGKVWEI